MKKTLATLLALIMALACMPITAHASADSIAAYFPGGIQKPKTPYIHLAFNDAWDEIFLYQDANDDIINFGEIVNAVGADNFMSNNGLWDLYAQIRVDYKIDNGNWHHTANWDDDYIDNIPNSGLNEVTHNYTPGELANKMLSFKFSDAIAYNFDDPAENGDFTGCVSRGGAYPDYTNYRFDTENHTYTYRYRYKIFSSDSDGSRNIYSPWSDSVSIGKNATQQTLTKNLNPAALTIRINSHLNIGSDSKPQNGFWLGIDNPQSIYDDLKYYEIIEKLFEPLMYEVEYRVNGGAWQEGGVANATWLDVDKPFNGTQSPLKKGDKVEFRVRIAEGADKSIKGPWSNIASVEAQYTDYDYKAPAPSKPAAKPEPAISNLNGNPSATQVNKYVTSLRNDNDITGSSFAKLQFKQAKITNTSIKTTSNKIAGAKYYALYGNKCGRTNPYKFIKTSSSPSFTVTGLKKGTYYKYFICAFNANGKLIASSRTTHIVTKCGKYCNFKKVTTKAKKNKVTLAKKGKTFKLGAKAVKEDSKKKTSTHKNICYESSNTKIATVDKKGKITAKKKGTCYVYAYAQNGVFAKIKVTVKK